MGNEIGNRNINGLQALEHDNTEITTSTTEPSDTLIVPSPVDRLKLLEQEVADRTASSRDPDTSNDEDDKEPFISSMGFENLDENIGVSAKNDDLIPSADKEGVIIGLGDASKSPDIDSALELTSDEHFIDEINPLVDELMIHESKTFEVERNELIASPADLSISVMLLEASESSGELSPEMEQENSNTKDGNHEVERNELIASPADISLSVTMLEASESSGELSPEMEQENGNTKDGDLQTSDHETEEKPTSNDGDEETTTLNHTQSLKDEDLSFDRCVLEINKNQEAFSKVGAEKTSTTIIESENQHSDKHRTPLVSLLKDEVYVSESFEEEDEGFVVKKVVEDVWRSPAKRIMTASARDREKPKQRASIFSNCMCCTTAIN